LFKRWFKDPQTYDRYHDEDHKGHAAEVLINEIWNLVPIVSDNGENDYDIHIIWVLVSTTGIMIEAKIYKRKIASFCSEIRN